MIVLFVLLIFWLVFRGAGLAGVPALDTWYDSARHALAVMFVFTSTAHFNRMRHDLARMIPPLFPQPKLIVFVTGMLEFAGAVGLILPPCRRSAGLCLIALLAAMFTANVNAVVSGVTLHGKPATPLWLRTPMQILFIALLWWTTQS